MTKSHYNDSAFSQSELYCKDESFKANLLNRITRCVGLLAIVASFTSGCSKQDFVLPEMITSEIWTSGIAFTKSDNQHIQLQLSEAQSFDQITLDTLIDGSTIKLSNLKSDFTYFYRFRLNDSGEISDYSAISSFKTIALPSPTNLTIERKSGDEVQISWDEIKGVDFDIQLSTNLQIDQLLSDFGSIHIANNKRIIESLYPDTEYYLRIRSKNRNAVSDWVEFEKFRTTNTLKFTLRSLDFLDRGRIPTRFACNNLSPELHWKNIPSETESLAIIMEDLDFRDGYNHWIIFNISPHITQLAQGSTGNNKPPGSREGTNDTGNQLYFGPCPPGGESHRYDFTLISLNRMLTINGGNINQFLSASEPYVLSKTVLRGIYE